MRTAFDLPATHTVDEAIRQAADLGHESPPDIDTPADYADLLARRTGYPTTLDLAGRRIV